MRHYNSNDWGGFSLRAWPLVAYFPVRNAAVLSPPFHRILAFIYFSAPSGYALRLRQMI